VCQFKLREMLKMKKATVTKPNHAEDKVAASEFEVEVHHKCGNVVSLVNTNYTYEAVFEYIKEEYQDDMDYIKKITIEVKR
jgi:hypothetical protein